MYSTVLHARAHIPCQLNEMRTVTAQPSSADTSPPTSERLRRLRELAGLLHTPVQLDSSQAISWIKAGPKEIRKRPPTA